jgi:UDP-glucose 4-epimerase
MRIAVTGAAGFVGGAVLAELADRGHDLLAIDTTPASPRMHGVTYCPGLVSSPGVANALVAFQPQGCVHLAASIDIEESKRHPLNYWVNNVAETLTLLTALERSGCRRIVFASTAAVYASHPAPAHQLCEADPTAPANPYGSTKLTIEHALNDLSAHGDFQVGIVRFFNAAGALPHHGEAHQPESHLIPRVITAALTDTPLDLYGTDYPTPDGTALRDYVHIADIATACARLLDALDRTPALTINVGSGTGVSVLEVIHAVGQLTGRPIDVLPTSARPGEPAALVADISLAQRTLRWAPQRSTLNTILTDALAWHIAQSENAVHAPGEIR